MFSVVLSYRILSRPGLIVFTIFLCATTAAAQPTDTTATLIQRAYKLTAQRKNAEAEAVYRQLASQSPADGYPALARFLNLTGQTTGGLELLNQPAVQALTPLVQGRVAAAAGAHDRAVELLRRPANPNEQYAQLSLLVSELEMLGRKQDATTALASALSSPALKPRERSDLFKRLQNRGESAAIRQQLPAVIEHLVASGSTPFPEIRQLAVDALNALAVGDDYAAFVKQVDHDAQTSSSAAWLYALSAIKRGDVSAAKTALDTRFKVEPDKHYQLLLGEELARLSVDDLDRAIAIYRQILPNSSEPDRLRLALGQLLFRKHSYDEAAENAAQINAANLEDTQRKILEGMRLAIAAKKQPAKEAVSLFESYSGNLNWEDLRELAQNSFSGAPSNGWAQDLRSAIKSRQQETSAPALNAMLAAAESYLQNPTGEAAAVAAYCDAQPDDSSAKEAYAELTDKAAQQVSESPKVAPEVAKETADTAAEALWKLVREKPYVPDNYVKLMDLYKKFGDNEKARKTPLYLASSPKASPGDVELAAYLLATNGFAEDAIPLYERALKAEPGNAKFRLNFAAALGRVNRGAEAQKIYHDVIQNGVNGKQYHVHEVYQSAYELAERDKTLEDFVGFMKSLINKKDVAQHSQFLLDAGKLMATHGRYDDAQAFFAALRTQYPERTDEAEQGMLDSYVAQKNFEKAQQLLAAEQARTTNTKDLVSLRVDQAYLASKRGDNKTAVEQLEKLAAEYPKERQAATGLVTAAQLLMDGKQPDRARELLQKFLAMESGDLEYEQRARDMLAQLKAAQPAGDAVKSAMEYAPAGK